MNLTAVLAFLGLQGNYPSIELQNLCLDSREIQSGDLFLAVPGEKVDGREYVNSAIGNGAAAVLVESPYTLNANTSVPVIKVDDLKKYIAPLAAAFYEHPARKLKIIAVTGTNGKTSCSHYVAQIFNHAGQRCGVMGTVGNGMLDNLHVSQLTTSDPCTVQSELARMHHAQANYVAIEASSHALEQQRLLGLEFNTAIFTNLSQDHLDYHENMQSYFAAKTRLFTEYKLNNAVINLDDRYGKKLLKLIPEHVKVITYSNSSNKADVYLKDCQIHSPWGSADFNCNLLGEFNKSNVLASIAACCMQGIEFATVMAAVAHLKPVAGRMQLVTTESNSLPKVVVDYAHTPDAVAKALQALREHVHGKLYCIVGCGGDRDRRKRPLMLNAALDFSDHVIITQDNPRTEDPQQIVNDMLQGRQLNNIHIEMDRAHAINETIKNAAENDMILIAGKGHEDYQIIGSKKFPFSDFLIAQQALLSRSTSA